MTRADHVDWVVMLRGLVVLHPRPWPFSASRWPCDGTKAATRLAVLLRAVLGGDPGAARAGVVPSTAGRSNERSPVRLDRAAHQDWFATRSNGRV